MHPVSRATKRRFRSAIQATLSATRGRALDEAAFPAYAHRNPLIEFVFWRRLSVAFDAVLAHGGTSVLDFGCGSGVLAETIAAAGRTVTAVDIDLGPKRLLERRIAFADSIDFREGDLASLALGRESFDVVVALDVLEHVSPLEPCLAALHALLRPGGLLVVSGPTENRLYRLGRRLAGAEFTGDYHVHGIREVAAGLRELFEVRTIAKVPWPATLFEILACRPKRL